MTRHFTHPKSPLQWREALLLWATACGVIFACVGLFLGLVVLPADYQQGKSVRITYTQVPAEVQLNKRQFWFLSELAKGGKLKTQHLTSYWKVSDKTSKRDISFLKKHNFIEYEGSPKTGYYKIKQQDNSTEPPK